jgi:murein tripeptide amidase MpaA
MPYPTVTGYDTELAALAAAHPSICSLVQVNLLSGRTHEGRDVYALRVGVGSGPDRPAVLVVAGLHAREWAPPDAVLSFARRMVEAYAAQSAITLPRFVDGPAPALPYPQVTLPWPSVREIVERLDVHLLPMANPDGRIFSHAHPGYRKNRRPSLAACPPFDRVDELLQEFFGFDDHFVPFGVDLNRNFGDPEPSRGNVLWAFERYFSEAGTSGLRTSSNPCDLSQVYRGDQAASEPETRNVQQLISQHRVRWFLDVHSYGHLVLYPWGLDYNGSDPTQSFTNPAWDRSAPGSGRDGASGSAYSEYVPDDPPHRVATQQRLYAETIAQAILRCGGELPNANLVAYQRAMYRPQQSTVLYPTSGESISYAFSRQLLPPPEPTWGPVFAFTIECGSTRERGFHPSARMYPKVEREVHAGIFAFLTSAANLAQQNTAAPVLPELPAPSTGP